MNKIRVFVFSLFLPFLAVSGSGAVTWNIETIDISTPIAGYYDIALDSGDRPHVCFAASSGLFYMTKTGGSWVVSLASSQNYPWPGNVMCCIAVSTSGAIHIAHAQNGVTYTRSDDNGATWQDEVVNGATYPPDFDAGAPSDIILDSYGNPYISFGIQNVDGWSVVIASRSSSGSWTKKPSNDSYDISRITMCRGTDGNLYFGYASESHPNYYVTIWKWYNQGSSGSMVYRSAGVSNTSFSSMAVDKNNVAHVVYQSTLDNYSSYIKYLRYDLAGTAYSPETIETIADMGTLPSAAVDSQNNPHFVFGKAEYATLQGTTWYITSQGDYQGSYWGKLVIDSSDNPHVLYGNRYASPGNATPFVMWPSSSEDGQYDYGVDSSTWKFADSNTRFEVKYIDRGNEAPMDGYPKIHISSAGAEIPGSPFAMAYASGAYDAGAYYQLSRALPAGSPYTWYFEAKDASENVALGNAVSAPNGYSIAVYPANMTIGGHLLDSGGQPMRNVPVYITYNRYNGGSTSLVVSTMTTGSDGGYMLEGLKAGYYNIEPGRAGYSFYPASTTINWLEVSQENLDFAGETLKITGTIKDGDTQELLGRTTVYLSGASATDYFTLSDGYYEFTGLNTGSAYSVAPGKSNYLFYPSSRTYSVLNSSASGQDYIGFTRRINGYVKDGSSQAISGVNMYLSGSATTTVKTASNGFYEFAGLSSGSYTLSASSSEYIIFPSSYTYSVFESSETNQNFGGIRIQRFYVNGYIKESDTQPVSGVNVNLYGLVSATYTTQADGYYEFSTFTVTTGQYVIYPEKENYSFNPSSMTYTLLGSSYTNQNYTGIFHSTEAYSSSTFRLYGYVRDPGGSGVADTVVYLYSNSTVTYTTQADGYYEFNNLAGASYYVLVSSKAGWLFTPGYVEISSPTADALSQNFLGVAEEKKSDIPAAVKVDVEYDYNDRKLEISLDGGTFVEDVVLNLKIPDTLPDIVNQPNLKATNIGLEITNDKSLQPQKSFRITLEYKESDVATLNEKLLVLAYYDTLALQWKAIPSTVYPDQNKITGLASHLSVFRMVQLTPSENLDNAGIYPNPFHPGEHKQLNFVNLSTGTEVYIYDITGRRIVVLDSGDSGNSSWDGTEGTGEPASSGVYAAYIEDRTGRYRIIKFVIER